MGGLPHEQYRVHSSEKPALRGIRYDPLRYGLKPTRYRVRHFGHSTQCRTRDIAMPYGDEGTPIVIPKVVQTMVGNNTHLTQFGHNHYDPAQ